MTGRTRTYGGVDITADPDWNKLVGDYARRRQANCSYRAYKENAKYHAEHSLETGTDHLDKTDLVQAVQAAINSLSS